MHLDDVIGSIDFLEQYPELTGPINVSSPNPLDSVGVMRELRAALGVPFGLPLTRPLLELGSMAIRTETELVLKSRWVLPERLLAAGYVFRYPELQAALRAIVSPTS